MKIIITTTTTTIIIIIIIIIIIVIIIIIIIIITSAREVIQVQLIWKFNVGYENGNNTSGCRSPRAN